MRLIIIIILSLFVVSCTGFRFKFKGDCGTYNQGPFKKDCPKDADEDR